MREVRVVEVVAAGEADKAIIRNMLQLYLHDFSEFEGWDLDAHGLFGYRYLDHYWVEAGRFPFLIRVDGQLAGFALVRREDGPEAVAHLAEFFVLRAYRGRGVGTAAAEAVFRRFPGAWQVNELPRNVGALAFWRRVIGMLTDGAFEERVEAESGRVVQTFRVGGLDEGRAILKGDVSS